MPTIPSPIRSSMRSLERIMIPLLFTFTFAGAVFAAASASDDFERSSLGGNWQVNFGNVGIVNNSDLGLLSQSGMGLVTWQGSTFDVDQYSEAVISADKAPNMLVQAFVRRRASDAARYGFHYDDDPNDSTAGENAWQFKYDGVPSTDTRIIASNASAPAPQPGDTIRIEARGANPVELRGYLNGTLILTAQDTAAGAIADGSPGLAYRLLVGTNTTYPTPVVESWRGGTLDTNAETPPTTSPPLPAAEVSLTAEPALIASGQSSTLTWFATNAASCTGGGFSTGGAVSGSISVNPTSNTTYSVSCTGAGGSATAYATVSVATPLIAHYAFDEASGTVAGDSSGNGNTGILTNGPIWTAGKIGEALEFDGIDDWVDLPGLTNDFDVNKGTFALWMKRTFLDTVSENKFALNCATDNSNYTSFFYSSFSDSWWARYTAGGSNDEVVVSAGSVPINEWAYILWTWDTAADQLKFYINGVQVGTTQSTLGTWAGAVANCKIAQHVTASSNEFQGLIDDVRVYNRALTDSEIQQLSDFSPPTVPQDLTATPVSTSQIDLSWSASTDNVGVTEYDVYRDGTFLASVTGTAYQNIGLAANTSYSYQVGAKDAAGNVSGLSASASATTQAAADTTAPTLSNIIASSITTASADITFTTNEGAISQVEYGTSINYGAQTPVTTTYTTTHVHALANLQANALYHYRILAEDQAGNLAVSADYTFTTDAAPIPPTALIVANPETIMESGSSTLSWSSTDATSCTGTNFSTGGAVSGSVSVSPTQTTTYSVSCTGDGGSVNASATVTVTPAPPTASLTANQTSITAGQSSTLTWTSTKATSCTGTGFSTGGTLSGSVSVSPSVTTTYTVTCTGLGGTAEDFATVSVNAPPVPTASLTATPSTITEGETSTLVWSSTDATSCTGTGFSTGNQTSGSHTVSPANTTTYSISCTGAGGSASDSAAVTVNPPSDTTPPVILASP